jgi:hypothetical protein
MQDADLIKKGAKMDDKAQLIKKLGEEFNRWEELLTGISEEQITAANFIDSLSIKDILAHLTVWQQISVARMEAARHNKEPEYPNWHPEFDPESKEELAKINALIYETRHELPWSDVHREWKERYLRFLELAESIPEKDLLEIGKYPWLREYPLSAVLLGSYEHHEEHLEPLIVLLRQDGKL